MDNASFKMIINFFRSSVPITILSVILVVLVGILALVHRKSNKWLRIVGIPTFIVGLIFVLLRSLIESALILVINDNAEDVKDILVPFVKLITDSFMTYGLILIAVGVIMIGLYIIVKKKNPAIPIKEEEIN